MEAKFWRLWDLLIQHPCQGPLGAGVALQTWRHEASPAPGACPSASRLCGLGKVSAALWLVSSRAEGNEGVLELCMQCLACDTLLGRQALLSD